ncbi:hypothetical protein ACFL5A_02740 [Gemmatimonadota bacterium]
MKTEVDPVSVSAGSWTTCLLVGDGSLRCWGYNESGVLGTGDTQNASTLMLVSGDHNITSVSAGWLVTCAIDATGAGYCWGMNESGQLGDGTSTQRTAPVAVVGGLGFLSLTGDYGHTCGLTREGRAYCWGANGADEAGWGMDGEGPGRLGDGTTENRSTPVPVAGDHKFERLAVGPWHTCGLTGEGKVFCWGAVEWDAELDGSTDIRLVPTAVEGPASFIDVTVGVEHSCALSTDGSAYCWGMNDYGQVGDGSTETRFAPTLVNAPRLTTIDAGAHHTCGLTESGDAYCWGDNSSGQIGDGTTTNALVALRVNVQAAGTRLDMGQPQARESDRTVRVGETERRILVAEVGPEFFHGRAGVVVRGRPLEQEDFEAAAADREVRPLVMTVPAWESLSNQFPLGADVLIDGRAFRVVGLYQDSGNWPPGVGIFIAHIASPSQVDWQGATRNPSGSLAMSVAESGMHFEVVAPDGRGGTRVDRSVPAGEFIIPWDIVDPTWVTDDSLTFTATRMGDHGVDELPGTMVLHGSDGWTFTVGRLRLEEDGGFSAKTPDGGLFPLVGPWGGTAYSDWLSGPSTHVIFADECCVLVHEPSGESLWFGRPDVSPSGEWAVTTWSDFSLVDEGSHVKLVHFTGQGLSTESINLLGRVGPFPRTKNPFGLVKGARWIDDATIKLEMTTIPEWLPDYELSEVEPFTATLRLDEGGIWRLYDADGAEVELVRR